MLSPRCRQLDGGRSGSARELGGHPHQPPDEQDPHDRSLPWQSQIVAVLKRDHSVVIRMDGRESHEKFRLVRFPVKFSDG